jgi:hypothetical protein
MKMMLSKNQSALPECFPFSYPPSAPPPLSHSPPSPFIKSHPPYPSIKCYLHYPLFINGSSTDTLILKMKINNLLNQYSLNKYLIMIIN